MKIQSIDYRDLDAYNHFSHSLAKTGFAILSEHPIEQTLIKEVYEKWHILCITPQIERRFHCKSNTDFTSIRTLITPQVER